MTDRSSAIGGETGRGARVSQVLHDLIARRSTGEAVSDDAVIGDHPELMPELGERLRVLGLVEHAERQAKNGPQSAGSGSAARSFLTRDSAGPSPEAIPGYTIEREIHRGGQGVVYQGVQKTTQRAIAVKVMREGPFASPQGRARFEREVEILARLRHPNIVTVYDSGTAAGSFFFVMDYIAGRPLDGYVENAEKSKNRKVDTEALLRLFARICDAVNAAHLIGVIHRDLKPGNILVDETGEPQILDFGLARIAEDNSIQNLKSRIQNLTMTGQFIGSLPWASPEQVDGRLDQIDVRTDVYSLGVILYQLLTGRFPYEVNAGVREVLDNIIKTEPAPMRKRGQEPLARGGQRGQAPLPIRVCPEPESPPISDIIASKKKGPDPVSHPDPFLIDGEIETIVLKCLAKDRDRRYQTAGELARDLRRCLTGEAIEAKRDSTWYVLRKTLRRYRVHAVVAFVFIALITTAAAALSVMYARQRGLLATANRETRKAQRTQDFLQRTLDAVAAATQGGDLSLQRVLLADLVKNVEAELTDEPEVEAAVRDAIGRAYQRMALYEEAEHHLRSALAIRRRVFGADHLQVAESLYNLAELLRDRTQVAASEPLLIEALDLRRRLLGDEHPGVAAVLDSLGIVRQHHGDYAGADAMHREALAISRKRYGDQHPDVARSLTRLGLLYFTREDYAASEPLLREALAIHQRAYGDEHPETAGSEINLAKLLRVRGEYAEAEPLFRQAVATYRKLLGDEHDNVAWGLHQLGRLLQAQSDFAQAEPLMREALAIYRKSLGDDDPYTARTLQSLGTLLLDLGRYDEAEPLFEEAMAIWRRRRGNDADFLAWNLNRMGELRERQGDYAAAEPLLREALAHRGERGHFGHDDFVRTLQSLARLSAARGDSDEAAQLALQAYEFRRDFLGEDHSETEACRRFLDTLKSGAIIRDR